MHAPGVLPGGIVFATGVSIVTMTKTRSMSVVAERFYDGFWTFAAKQVRDGIWQAP